MTDLEIRTLGRAIRQDPADPHAYARLFVAQTRAGLLDPAILETAGRAAPADPMHPLRLARPDLPACPAWAQALDSIDATLKRLPASLAFAFARQMAHRALPAFEQPYPLDGRPRRAIGPATGPATRPWVSRGAVTKAMNKARRDQNQQAREAALAARAFWCLRHWMVMEFSSGPGWSLVVTEAVWAALNATITTGQSRPRAFQQAILPFLIPELQNFQDARP